MMYTIDHPEPGTAVTWALTEDGVERETHTYHPTLYVETDTEALRREGRLADEEFVDGEPADVYRFGLLAREWLD